MKTYDTVIIIASGALDCTELLNDELKNRENKYLICADGGINHLKKLNITPDLIIGDFDSADYCDINCEVVKLNPIKDETDLEYIINTVTENISCKNVKIFAATGKRMDHTLSNIFCLKTFLNNNISAEIYDGYNIIKVFTGVIAVDKCEYKYLSLIPLENCNHITAEGVKYPLKNECLNPFASRGISNEITADTAHITSDVPTILILSDDKKKG